MKRTSGMAELKRVMRERELSQEKVAKLMKVGQSAVSLWVRGLSRPEPEHRIAMEILLGVPARAWMTAEERKVVERAESVGAADDAPDAPDTEPAPTEESGPGSPAARASDPAA